MSDQQNNKNVIDINLDEGLKKVKKHLKNFFSLGALIFALLIMIFGGMYKIDTGTVGVITRFGAIQGVNEQAGIHFKVPFIDHVEIVDVQTVYTMEYGFRTAKVGTTTSNPDYADEATEAQVIVEAGKDNASIILLNLITRFQVEDPVKFLYSVDDLEGTMRLALEDAVRSTLPSFTIDHALENKELIDQEIFPKLQKKLDKYNSGIKIVQVTTQNVSLLPSVEEARQQVEEANQYKQGRVEEAEKYKNTVIPRADAEATKLLEDAKGYHAETLANANSDVAEFEALYSQYQVNPEMVKEKYYIEAMQEVLKNNKLIIDQSDDNNLLKFYDVNDDTNKTVKEGGLSE